MVTPFPLWFGVWGPTCSDILRKRKERKRARPTSRVFKKGWKNVKSLSWLSVHTHTHTLLGASHCSLFHNNSMKPSLLCHDPYMSYRWGRVSLRVQVHTAHEGAGQRQTHLGKGHTIHASNLPLLPTVRKIFKDHTVFWGAFSCLIIILHCAVGTENWIYDNSAMTLFFFLPPLARSFGIFSVK